MSSITLHVLCQTISKSRDSFLIGFVYGKLSHIFSSATVHCLGLRKVSK